MKSVLIFALSAALAFGGSLPSSSNRGAVVAMERSIDREIDKLGILEDGFYLESPTRGIYLSGYGAVFSAELNLVSSAVRSPFRPEWSKEDLAKLKLKKQQRIITLKRVMRDLLVSVAASLDTVPAMEQVVLGMNLFYYSWEDSAGLPTQIVMRAPRKALLDAQRGKPEALTASLRLDEF